MPKIAHTLTLSVDSGLCAEYDYESQTLELMGNHKLTYDGIKALVKFLGQCGFRSTLLKEEDIAKNLMGEVESEQRLAIAKLVKDYQKEKYDVEEIDLIAKLKKGVI